MRQVTANQIWPLTAAEEDQERHRLPHSAAHAVEVDVPSAHGVVVPDLAAEAGQLFVEDACLVAAGALMMTCRNLQDSE